MRFLQRGLRAALFLSLGVVVMSDARSDGVKVEAWLEAAPADGKVVVQAFARGGPVPQLRYELNSDKTAGTGASTTRQAGMRNLACCEPVVLSKVSLGGNANDRYKVTLKVFAGSDLLAEKTLTWPE
jgi:hypothetical protein